MRSKRMMYLCLLMAILSYPPSVWADDPLLFWADSEQDSIYRSALDGSNPQVLVDEAAIPRSTSAGYGQSGVVVDRNYIYWTDVRQDSIYRSGWDGSNPQILINRATIPQASGGSASYLQFGVAVDRTYIYWTDGSQESIYRSALDGSNPHVLVDVSAIPKASGGDRLYSPRGLAVDSTYIYWADGFQGSIYRSALDGGNPHVLVDEAIIPQASGGVTTYFQQGLAVDSTYIYWADPEQDSIYRSALDGSNPHVLVDKAAIPQVAGFTNYFPNGVAVDRNYIYWADSHQQSIYRSALDGSNPHVLVHVDAIPWASDRSVTYHQSGIAIFRHVQAQSLAMDDGGEP